MNDLNHNELQAVEGGRITVGVVLGCGFAALGGGLIGGAVGAGVGGGIGAAAVGGACLAYFDD